MRDDPPHQDNVDRSASAALPKAYWLLWTGQTLSRIGIIAPAFLVLYLQETGLTGSGSTPVVIGLFATGVVVAGLLGGVFADTIGPRRAILFSQPFAIATALLFLVASGIVLIGALSLIAGFLSAVDRPAAAGLIAKIVPPQSYSRAYSIFLIGFNVGMSVGPVLSGFLLALYPPGLFILWGVCGVIYAVLARALPADDPHPDIADDPGRGDAVGGAGGAGTSTANGASTALRRVLLGVAEPFRSPVMLAFLALVFLIACIYLQVNSALPLDMRAKGLDPAQIGMVLAVNAVLMVLFLPFVPRIVRGMRDETPLVLAGVFIAIGFGMNALADDVVMFVVALVVWTAGEVMFAPMSATFLAKRAPAGRTSTYQGSFFFAWNAAFVVGGPGGVAIAQAFGFDTLWICALLLGAGVAIGFRLISRIPGYAVPAENIEKNDAPALGGK